MPKAIDKKTKSVFKTAVFKIFFVSSVSTTFSLFVGALLALSLFLTCANGAVHPGGLGDP